MENNKNNWMKQAKRQLSKKCKTLWSPLSSCWLSWSHWKSLWQSTNSHKWLLDKIHQDPIRSQSEWPQHTGSNLAQSHPSKINLHDPGTWEQTSHTYTTQMGWPSHTYFLRYFWQTLHKISAQATRTRHTLNGLIHIFRATTSTQRL